MTKPELIFGTESFLIEEETNSRLNALPGEIAQFEGEFDWNHLQDAVNLSSLFSSQKKILIKNPWFLSKTLNDKSIAQLKEALDSINQSEHPTIILYQGNIDQRKKPFKLIKSVATVTQFEPYKDWELEKVQQWLTSRAKQNNLSITPEAVWALTEHCGIHLRQIAGELEKLRVYVGTKQQIDLDDVKAVCMGPQGSSYDFTEALKLKQHKKALLYLKRLMSHGEDPIKIHGLMTATFRLYLQLLSGLSEGHSNQSLGKALGKHPFFLQKLIPDVKKNYTIPKLTAAIQELYQCDVNIKSGKVSPQHALEICLNKLLI